MEIVTQSDEHPITHIYDGPVPMGIIHGLSDISLEAVPVIFVDGEWEFDTARCKDVQTIEEGLEWIRQIYNCSEPT